MRGVERPSLSSCEDLDTFYSSLSPHFFAPPSALERRGELLKLPDNALHPRIPITVSRAEAKQKYAELNTWNRDMHERMVAVLEPAFLRLTDRLVTEMASWPDILRQRARELEYVTIPYDFAGLPPNLFDHLDPSQPFLPATADETLKLVNDFRVYNERLRKYRPMQEIHIGKEHLYRDVALELLRRRRDTPELFKTAEEKRAWAEYNASFKASMSGKSARDTFHQNVRFVNYLQNRQFSEMGGFFEITDGMFDNFLLADYLLSRSAFTSQIRVPYNNGHQADAEDLLKATYLLMELIDTDQEIKEDIENYKSDDIDLLSAHLTRAREIDALVVPAVKKTLLEGVASISAVFSVCEADGIPAFENDTWGGLNQMLIDDVPVKVTATMAQGFIVPSTLHGNYLKDFLEMTKNGLRVRPDNAKKIQEVHDRRTIALHEQWARYYEAVERQANRVNAGPSFPQPPVRFGLHCPFKGDVVRRLSEALLVCRAIVCES